MCFYYILTNWNPTAIEAVLKKNICSYACCNFQLHLNAKSELSLKHSAWYHYQTEQWNSLLISSSLLNHLNQCLERYALYDFQSSEYLKFSAGSVKLHVLTSLTIWACTGGGQHQPWSFSYSQALTLAEIQEPLWTRKKWFSACCFMLSLCNRIKTGWQQTDKIINTYITLYLCLHSYKIWCKMKHKWTFPLKLELFLCIQTR